MSTAILVRRLRACALAPAVVVALATAVGAATPLPARTDRSIYDTAGVIEDADEAALEAEHKELFDKTGVAIVTITVPRLVDDTIEDFAVRAGQTWGVGKAGQDRGLVIALSVEDRKIFVATGYGTEGYLPDGKVGALLDREAIPALKKNRFSDGLVALDRALIGESAHEFGTTITGVPDRPVEQSRGSGIMTLLGIVVMLLIAMRHPWLFMLFGGFGGGGFGRRGRRDGGGDSGFGGFGGGGFGGGGAGRDF